MFKNLLFGGDGGASPVSDAGLLIFRLAFGLTLALAHGLGKIPPPEQFVGGVTAMGLPAWAAWLTVAAEFGGGLLLAAGLMTRPAALLVLINMLVAFFGAHGGSIGEGEMAFLFAMSALGLLLTGAGRFSADQFLRRSRGAYVERYRNT